MKNYIPELVQINMFTIFVFFALVHVLGEIIRYRNRQMMMCHLVL